MKSRQSNASSRSCLAASEWLSLTLITLLVLPGIGFATLLGTVSARSHGDRAGTASPARTDSKSSGSHVRLSRAHDGTAALAPQGGGILYTVNTRPQPRP